MSTKKKPTKPHGSVCISTEKSKKQPDLFALWGKTPIKASSQDNSESKTNQPVLATPPAVTIDLLADVTPLSSLTPDIERFNPSKISKPMSQIFDEKPSKDQNDGSSLSAVKPIIDSLVKESQSENDSADILKEMPTSMLETIAETELTQTATPMEIIDSIPLVVESKETVPSQPSEEPELPKKRKRKTTEKVIAELTNEQHQAVNKLSSILLDIEIKLQSDSLLSYVQTKLTSEFESKRPNSENEAEISEYIGLYIEGSSLPLSELSGSLSELLNLPFVEISERIKRLATRSNFGSCITISNIYEDIGDHGMLVWEVNLDGISISDALSKLIPKSRIQKKKYGQIMKIVDKAIKTCKSCTGDDLNSKFADSESKIHLIIQQIDSSMIAQLKSVSKASEKSTKLTKVTEKPVAKSIDANQMKISTFLTISTNPTIIPTSRLPSSIGSWQLWWDDASSPVVLPHKSLESSVKSSSSEVSIIVTVNDPNNPNFCELKSININSKLKLLSFSSNHRPAYYGTWNKRSELISGRRPLALDDNVMNYNVDSDDDWMSDDEAGDDVDSDNDNDDDDDKQVNNTTSDVIENKLDYDDGWLLHDHEMHVDDVLNDSGHLASVLLTSTSCNQINDNLTRFDTFQLREPDFKSIYGHDLNDETDKKPKICRLKELNDLQAAFVCQMIHGTRLGIDKIIANTKDYLSTSGISESVEAAGGVIKRTIFQVADKIKLSENSTSMWIVKPEVIAKLNLNLAPPVVPEESKKPVKPHKKRIKPTVVVAAKVVEADNAI